jgi:hypothetical protein
MQCIPEGKRFKIVKDIAITGGHSISNKTSSTSKTRSSIPTLASIPMQILPPEYHCFIHPTGLSSNVIF